MFQFKDIVTFWFGDLDGLGRADELHRKRWWTKDPSFDQSIRDQFGAIYAAVLAGQCEDWLTTPEGRLAFVIVLDQFSRNMFRGTAKMFAGDMRALEVAKQAVDIGTDRSVAFDPRGFLYMPFMHSEDLAMQERSVDLFRALRDEVSAELRDAAAYSLRFAEQHRDIVKRFGRFPHRNVALDRTSSPEEIEFLQQPGSAF